MHHIDSTQAQGLAIDVCVCTHQPRRAVLAIALRALARQSVDRAVYRVLVIDNACEPAIGSVEMAPLDEAAVTHRVIREDRLGTAYARARAIRESTAPIIVFVDDDNELCPTYLERVLQILEADPTLGCLGGKMQRSRDTAVPRWLEPLRHFIGIRDDLGDEPFSDLVTEGWSDAIPPTAGMAVRREVAELYLAFEHVFGGIGRKGERVLGSCEDVLLARQAHRLGLRCGYRPEVELVHHIDQDRLALGQLLRFFYGQGYTEARVGDVLGGHHIITSASWRQRLEKLARLRDPRALACLVARAAGSMVSSADWRRQP